MTEKKETKSKLNFPKSLGDAFVAGSTAGLASLALDTPPDQAIKIALAGSAVSLFLHWSRSAKPFAANERTQHRGRRVTVNTAKGKRDVKLFEFQPSYIARETWGETLRRWTVGKPQPRIPSPQPSTVNRPAEMDQFAFMSVSNDGQTVEIRSNDFRNFLKRAYLYRRYGKGFGTHFWGYENERSWPEWYPGPFWYEGAKNLVYGAERGLGRQLVRQTKNQWSILCWPTRMTYEHVLYWYVMENRK